MFEPIIIQGVKTTAHIYGDYPDSEELRQIYALLDLPPFAGAQVRIMPDHHAGKGCVIGFTCPIQKDDPQIVPALVGVDIGCGVVAARLPEVLREKVRLADFDAHFRLHVPSGFKNRNTPYKDLARLYKKHVDARRPWEDFQADVNRIDTLAQGDQIKVWQSIGSLGSGNHFGELDEDAEGGLWLVIHSGSRNFGLRVCQRHQKIAKEQGGRQDDLAWLSGDFARRYLQEMRIAQQVAALNRLVMLTELLGFFALSLDECEVITSVHNFIGDDDIIRKGAISAREGERVVIPWNMRDGLVLGVGKGNADWNYSAPHGSGRRMARGKAKRELSLEEFRDTMSKAGVWSSCVSKDTLDESPMAYKPTKNVLESLGDTVEVTSTLKPVYNFKAGGG